MPPASGRMIMNTEGDNNGGPIPVGNQPMHYGQQMSSQQQQPHHDDRQSQMQQPQHMIPGSAATTNYGAHGIMMNSGNNTGAGGVNNSRRRTEDEEHMSRGPQPTPLFERLVTEEVQELKAYARIIESQNRRLADLERVHGDLEARLEQESRSRQQLETTLEEREREWNEKYAELEQDRDHWKEVVQIEQTKNARLIEQVVRKDQDIQKMLQRKYDQPREGQHFSQSVRNYPRGDNEPPRGRNTTSNNSSRSPSFGQNNKSPHEILADNGDAQEISARNAADALMEFFNLR